MPFERRAALGSKALARLLAVVLTATPVAAETVDLSFENAREVARAAMAEGNPALANALAYRLVQADPDDAQALLLLSASETMLGNPGTGRKAGRAAWRVAGNVPELRYEIARHTALAAFQEQRLTTAQFWLRRAADYAPSKAEYAQTIDDFRKIRNLSPLRFAVDLAVQPSSNLNGGSKGGLLIIDDRYLIGTINRAGQALSGVRSTADLRLSYALPPGSAGQSTLGLHAFGSFHSLSAEARQSNAGVRGRDLDQQMIEASLGRDFYWPASRHPVSFGVAAGQSWAGGRDVGPHLRLMLASPVMQHDATQVVASGSVEYQWQDTGLVRALSLGLQGNTRMSNGAQIGWAISAADVNGDGHNQVYRSLNGTISYALAQPIGPVEVSARLNAGIRVHDTFLLGPIAVTDGRTDHSLGVSVDLLFTDVGLWGYAPKLSISQTQTRSNISKYDTLELGILFGFESRF